MPPIGDEEKSIQGFTDLFKPENRGTLGTVIVNGDRIIQEKIVKQKKDNDEKVFLELKKEEPEAVEEEEAKKLKVSRIKSEQDENLENSLVEAQAAKVKHSNEEKKVDKNESPQTKQVEPASQDDTILVKEGGVETYTEKGVSRKDIIVLQVHIKKKNVSEEILNLIEDKVGSNVMGEKEEKKGAKQDRKNVNQKGGVSFSDFTSIARESGYFLDKVWKRKDTEYVDGELAGEEGIAIGFVFKKKDKELKIDPNKEKEEVLKYFIKNKLYNVDFHLNSDGSTVMSAFGGIDYNFKDGLDKIKRQVFIDSNTGVLLGVENKYDYVSIDTEKQDIKEIAKNIWEESLKRNQILTRDDFDDLYKAIQPDTGVEKDLALQRLLKKNIDIKKFFEDNEDKKEEYKKAIILAYEGRPDGKNNYSDEVQEAREKLKTTFGSVIEKKAVSNADKTEKETIWDEEVIKDLDLVSNLNNKQDVIDEAWKRLNKKGFFMKKDRSEDAAVIDALCLIIDKRSNKRFGDDTKKAEDFLKEYFGVGKQDIKMETPGERKVWVEGFTTLLKQWILAKSGSPVFNLQEQEKKLKEVGFNFLNIDNSLFQKIQDAVDVVQYSSSNKEFENSEKAKEFLLGFLNTGDAGDGGELAKVPDIEKSDDEDLEEEVEKEDNLVKVEKSDKTYKVLMRLADAGVTEREELFEVLEHNGIRIGECLEHLKEAGIKDVEVFYKHLQVMMKLLSLPEDRVKKDFSRHIATFSSHAALLGIKWYN